MTFQDVWPLKQDNCRKSTPQQKKDQICGKKIRKSRHQWSWGDQQGNYQSKSFSDYNLIKIEVVPLCICKAGTGGEVQPTPSLRRPLRLKIQQRLFNVKGIQSTTVLGDLQISPLTSSQIFTSDFICCFQKPQIQVLLSEKIIWGHEVKPHSCPYLTFTEFLDFDGNRTFCGDFLVRDDFVLTAAHCKGR